MKNQFQFPKLSVLVVTTGLLLSYSCKKDEPVVSVDACIANADLVSKAATLYGTTPTKANCDAYVATLNKYYDSCPGLTAVQRSDLKTQIAGIKCQ
jgi:hypothetical protein